MDYRVKVTPDEAPSIFNAVRNNGKKYTVNGVIFGWSDRESAVLSEPVNQSQIEPFDGIPGYIIVDASTGAIVREPPARVTLEKPPETGKPMGSAEDHFADKFLNTFNESSATERQRINNDEYKRVLSALNIRIGPDDTKADYISYLEDYLASR